MPEKKKILIVEPEEFHLQSLYAGLSECAERWDFAFSGNAIEALTKLEVEKYDAVVTNIKLTGVDGAEFIHRNREILPNSVRIIMTTVKDKNILYQMTGCAHQFLLKPVKPLELIETLERAFYLRGILNDAHLMEIIRGMKSLPSAPQVYFELMQIIQSPVSSIIDIAEIIAKDQGLTVKIMQMVNSAFFGLPRKVENINLAVNLLGLETITNLTLMADVFQQYSDAILKEFSVDYLTQHSLNTALTAQSILKSEHAGEAAQTASYTAGLLHDVGKLVFIANMPQEYSQAVELSQAKKIPLFEAEREVMGADHQSVGAYLLNLWNFPDNITEMVACHHNPKLLSPDTFSPVTAIHIANYFEHMLNPVKEKIANNEVESYLLDVEYLKALGLGKKVRSYLEIYREIIRANGEEQKAELKEISK